MDDLISRQAAIEAAVEAADKWDGGYDYERQLIIEEALARIPSAERKKGKCMEENTRSASYIFKCSCCGKNAYFVHGKGRGRNCKNRYCGYDYCPNCGSFNGGQANEQVD